MKTYFYDDTLVILDHVSHIRVYGDVKVPDSVDIFVIGSDSPILQIQGEEAAKQYEIVKSFLKQ